MDAITDAQVSAVVHAQKIAHAIGHGQIAVEVYGWAIRNAMSISTAQLKELLDIVSKDPLA